MLYKYGRINRPTYFLMLTILVATYAVILSLMPKPPAIAEVMAILIAVPRLHDIGKTGWWAGAAILAEILVVVSAVVFATGAGKGEEIILMAGGLFVFVILGLMVVLGCIRGQDGVNKYGEAPPPGVSFKTYKMTKSEAEAQADAF